MRCVWTEAGRNDSVHVVGEGKYCAIKYISYVFAPILNVYDFRMNKTKQEKTNMHRLTEI